MVKDTLVVNLFGSPGSGKSTGAAYLFSSLKLMGIDCEYVSEFAKDKCWEGNQFIFENPENQFYIGAKQFYRINQVYGKVDYIITDSPIFMNSFYNKSKYLGEEYNVVTLRLFNKFKNISFFINRVKPYNRNGRNQTESESDKIAVEMKNTMETYKIPFIISFGNEKGYKQILDIILNYKIIKQEN